MKSAVGMRRRTAAALCLGLALSGCDTLNQMAQTLNELPIEDVANLLNVSAGLLSQRTAGMQYQAAPVSGYSQRGAFEDCAALYRGIAPQMEATCAQRARNMSTAK